MPASQDRPALFAMNCSALLFSGVGFFSWTLHYTDWFPVIGALLGLTGAFAWIGVFGNLLTEARKTALQLWIEQGPAVSSRPVFSCAWCVRA